MFVKFWRSFAECKWRFTCRPDLRLFPALYFKCVRSVRTHKIYSLTSHVSGLKEQFCLLGNGIISVLYHNVLSYDGLLFHLLSVGGVSCVTCSLGSGWKHSPVPVISPMTWSCTSPRGGTPSSPVREGPLSSAGHGRRAVWGVRFASGPRLFVVPSGFSLWCDERELKAGGWDGDSLAWIICCR